MTCARKAASPAARSPDRAGEAMGRTRPLPPPPAAPRSGASRIVPWVRTMPRTGRHSRALPPGRRRNSRGPETWPHRLDAKTGKPRMTTREISASRTESISITSRWHRILVGAGPGQGCENFGRDGFPETLLIFGAVVEIRQVEAGQLFDGIRDRDIQHLQGPVGGNAGDKPPLLRGRDSLLMRRKPAEQGLLRILAPQQGVALRVRPRKCAAVNGVLGRAMLMEIAVPGPVGDQAHGDERRPNRSHSGQRFHSLVECRLPDESADETGSDRRDLDPPQRHLAPETIRIRRRW